LFHFRCTTKIKQIVVKTKSPNKFVWTFFKKLYGVIFYGMFTKQNSIYIKSKTVNRLSLTFPIPIAEGIIGKGSPLGCLAFAGSKKEVAGA
jgi:hypothetical protein